jgi:hypothetical protein
MWGDELSRRCGTESPRHGSNESSGCKLFVQLLQRACQCWRTQGPALVGRPPILNLELRSVNCFRGRLSNVPLKGEYSKTILNIWLFNIFILGMTHWFVT